MDPIIITEPVTIRSYSIGGKGGTAAHSSPLHRLTERRSDSDITACRTQIMGGKIAVVEGPPKAKAAARYGVCQRCWPEVKA